VGRVRDGLREVEPQLTEYLRRLGERIPLSCVALFGSRARNDHWRTSDIDLLVVSPAFAGKPRPARLDLLLEDWDGIPALEPFGCTPEELLGYGGLLLWDALHQGRPLCDDGTWEAARKHFERRLSTGELTPTAGGWRESLDPV